jgi:hypothetical protein
MDETITKLRILARAETTLARLHARILARRILLALLGLGAVLLTIGLFNLGAYELLAARYGAGTGAFVLAGANAALAGLLLALASRHSPGPEEQMVLEIRELAMAELSADVEAARAGFNELSSDLERIRTGIGALTGGGGGFGLASLGPVIGLAVDALKSRKS